MKEIRAEYKSIILQASRFATQGGAMSLAMEDFIIDFVNEIVDNLTDDQFDYLLEHKTIPANAIQTQEEYDRVSSRLIHAAELLESEKLLSTEYTKVMEYYDILTVLRQEYKEDGHLDN